MKRLENSDGNERRVTRTRQAFVCFASSVIETHQKYLSVNRLMFILFPLFSIEIHSEFEQRWNFILLDRAIRMSKLFICRLRVILLAYCSANSCENHNLITALHDWRETLTR